MEQVRIVKQVNNLEIISKLLNSVAKQYGCRVKYHPEDGGLHFYGDISYQKYIVEETLSFFSPGLKAVDQPIHRFFNIK
jgi:hypothetical protein